MSKSIKKKRILLCYGTRPEAIKMAPVISELRKNVFFDLVVVSTGQHGEMLDQVQEIFGIKPDYDLQIMSKAHSVESLLSLIIEAMSDLLNKIEPALILVHGDTATTLGASLAAYYCKVPIGHVEAGLRTYDLNSPWPEEGNRRLVSNIAALHFAPTIQAKLNLMSEQVNENKIFVTGNTVIDSVKTISKLIADDQKIYDELDNSFSYLKDFKKNILVTFHRRENFDSGLKSICLALNELAKKNDNVLFNVPVHLNPVVQDAVKRYLNETPNINLMRPQNYINFIFLMKKTTLVLSDSGGIQEEGTALNKPIFLLRDTSERPEAVKSGGVVIVGTQKESIVKIITKVLDNPKYLDDMSKAKCPYGDGTSARKIVKILENEFKNV